MKVIECEGLVKTYGSINALDRITFSIEENTITGLIGRNGAGKTTLLKVIAGFWRETEGRVKVFERSPFNNLEVSMNSIFVDDMMSFTYTLNLKEVLTEAQAFYPNWDAKLAEGLLEYFNFNPRLVHQSLSKGKRSTFNMIVGLAAKCPLTIFDEPTTGMDAAVRKDFYRALLKDYLFSPRTIIISSHHLDEMEDILEDILLVDEGKKVLQLPVDEFKEYAVTLSGKTAIVMQILEDKDVIYKRNIDLDSCSVVVRNNFSHESVKRLGINVSPVTPSDLCVYLTNQAKGGIDDVFNQSKSV
ncbi:ATP-binding cassette domain-containing protein [Paucisalibacillus sp. EB02]|uniref:ATP-binding cassette domain-containing protein n=1 Tax=Paucisalibacillus sp. EB02 TaxID=1347087 RepID=UPI0004ADA0E2|nr:ABC transporter ATP-binding protein [Paucisalibacillus sp. EB02]